MALQRLQPSGPRLLATQRRPPRSTAPRRSGRGVVEPQALSPPLLHLPLARVVGHVEIDTAPVGQLGVVEIQAVAAEDDAALEPPDVGEELLVLPGVQCRPFIPLGCGQPS